MRREMIDVYDENLRLIGQMERRVAHQSGAWHRTFHCWIIRPEAGGSVLFQKRGMNARPYPGLLDISAAGHYTEGEQQFDGLREVFEELGITAAFTELRYLGIKFDLAKTNEMTNREFCDVYFLQRPESVRNYKPSATEVQGLFEIAVDDGLRLFSGEASLVTASGIALARDNSMWIGADQLVSTDSFVPRIDPYYLKVFLLARLYLHGEKYLAI